MAVLKNNLFYYATKELSQDAFICWLSSFALEDADQTDSELVKCAHELVNRFMILGLGKTIEYDKVFLKQVQKQYKNIDVLLTVEYDETIYKIIVEDKTHSSEHDNQLIRYKDEIKKEYENVIGIYFKTGFQSNLSGVKEAEYHLFDREDVLDLLGKYNSNNDILKAYKEYWDEFESITRSYETKPVDEWTDWQAVNGFYDEIQWIIQKKDDCWASYDYVPNKSGGFWGLWYGINDDEIKAIDGFVYVLYLQIETKWNYERNKYAIDICLKLESKSENKNSDNKKNIVEFRNTIVNCILDFGFNKPDRLGYGQHMTVGFYKTTFKEKKDLVESVEASLECLRDFISFIRTSNSVGV